MVILLVALLVEHGYAFEDCKPCARRPLSVVVVGLRPSEIGKQAVAEILRYEAVEALNCFRGSVKIVSFDFAPLLGIKPLGNLCRADQIAKHDRQVSSLAIGVSRLGRGCRRRWGENGLAELSAAFTAELRGGCIVRTATRTAARKRGSAFRAKPPAFRTLDPTACATHRITQ